MSLPLALMRFCDEGVELRERFSLAGVRARLSDGTDLDRIKDAGLTKFS